MTGSWAQDKRQLTTVALVAVIAVLAAAGIWQVGKLGSGRTVTAYFTNASALFEDNAVQMLGVSIGTIDKITPEGDKVRVDMTITDRDVKLAADTKAAVISPSLVTGRNVTLFPTYTEGPELADGAVLGLDRTAVPLGVDDLTRTATGLSQALGPNGLNKAGALSDSLSVLAQNLDGNGDAVNDTIRSLGGLSGTLSGTSDDLFGTVTQLQLFTETIKNNDDAVREFNGRIADVTGILADQKEQLGAALAELATALDDVTTFVRDNRAILKSNVDRLVDVTRVLVDQRRALTEVLDVAPTALSNLANTYDATSGTLSTRANLNELASPPIYLICELLATGAPNPIGDALEGLPELCGSLPLANTLPSVQQILTALQAGQAPPVPGLALPVAPPAGTALAGATAPAAPPAPAGTPAPGQTSTQGSTPGSTQKPSQGSIQQAPPRTDSGSGGLGGLFGGGA